MITIDQLLESVDLDFEPRWVTKDNNGEIWIWNYKPVKDCNWHIQRNVPREFCGFFITNKIKLSDFENKDWTECIYEVPRKEVVPKMETTGKIERFMPADFATVRDINEYVRSVLDCRAFDKLNMLVDAVNELKAKGEWM